MSFKNRRVIVQTETPLLMQEWCAKQFGNTENAWAMIRSQTYPDSAIDRVSSYTFLFNKEEDAVMFALRWIGNENS